MHPSRHINQKLHPSPQASYNSKQRGHELHEERGLLLDAGEREDMAAERLPLRIVFPCLCPFHFKLPM
jgi:hypothetical protein